MAENSKLIREPPIFLCPNAAQKYLETLRWGENQTPSICPLCVEGKLITRIKQSQYFHCNSCHRQFTIRTGTILQRSHVPLNKWLHSAHLYLTDPTISSVGLAETVKITQKSAWLLLKKLRELPPDHELLSAAQQILNPAQKIYDPY